MNTQTANAHPVLIEASDISQFPDAGKLAGKAGRLVIVDLSKTDAFSSMHIPGAIHLEYSRIVRSSDKIGGLLPSTADMAEVLHALGVDNNCWLIAYDQQGGTAASRLIWTLHAFEFTQCSLLNGGLSAWLGSGQEAESGSGHSPTDTTSASDSLSASIHLKPSRQNCINSDELLHMQKDNRAITIIDARTANEYNGSDKRAEHGGHVPGAKWLEWKDLVDRNDHGRLLPNELLLQQFADIGISSADLSAPVVAYCQTHQRSSLTYVALRHLGFENVSGLEGAWSEWGNRTDTPIET